MTPDLMRATGDTDMPESGASPAAGRDTVPTLPDPASGIRADQMCSPQSDGASCWMEVSDGPECYVWNPNPQRDETVTRTATCTGGFAQGTGTLTWSHAGGQQTGNGRLRDGKTDGACHWVYRSANWSHIEEFQAEYNHGTRVR